MSELDLEILFHSSCGVVSYDRKTCVSLGEDLSKPYPDCCEKIKCIGNIDSNVVGN